MRFCRSQYNQITRPHYVASGSLPSAGSLEGALQFVLPLGKEFWVSCFTGRNSRDPIKNCCHLGDVDGVGRKTCTTQSDKTAANAGHYLVELTGGGSGLGSQRRSGIFW